MKLYIEKKTSTYFYKPKRKQVLRKAQFHHG